MGQLFRFEQEQTIPRPPSEVFAFFADARNLERLTPAFLGFRILTPGPIDMRPGTIIDYSLRLHGVTLNWRTRIEAFEPEVRFVDTQLKGPYRFWHHVHEFEEINRGTRMRDVVDYELPLGPLGILAHAVFVRKSLERIFGYRRQAIADIFGAV